MALETMVAATKRVRPLQGIVARALVSGGRSLGFVQAATPALVLFDKSGALTAIKRAR